MALARPQTYFVVILDAGNDLNSWKRRHAGRGQDDLFGELEVLAAASEGGSITAEKVARGAFSRRWA
jgi:hypothetical protein